MNDQELIQYFEERRGNVSSWSEKPVEAALDRAPSVVFSLRLSASELEIIRQRAEASGTTVSDLIRWAIACGMARPFGNPTLTRSLSFDGQEIVALSLAYTVSTGPATRGSAGGDILRGTPTNPGFTHTEGIPASTNSYSNVA